KKKYLLCSGVTVLEAQKDCVCLVLKTGGSTKKGELIKLLTSSNGADEVSRNKVFNIE
ncbi:unnamed protein product, partial [Amoebophrya sp. A25]